MTKAIDTQTTEAAEDSTHPALQNTAIAHCCEAWERAYQKSFKQDEKGNIYAARTAGGKAFRSAMPPLSGSQNIANFIACAAHGMLIGAIEEKSVTRLMYAAQVATGTARQADKHVPVA